MVETALVLPILLLLLLGIVQFGVVFSAKLVLENGSREAAREASVGVATATAQSNALAKIPGYVTSKTATVVISDDATLGKIATATVSGKVAVFTPFLSTVLGQNEFDLQSVTKMRTE